MSDKVRPAIWPHEGVSYYPDIAFPYNLFTAPTVCSRAGRQIQGIRIRLGLESRRHASNAQCIYSLLYSERLGYCLRLELTNFTLSICVWGVTDLRLGDEATVRKAIAGPEGGGGCRRPSAG